LHHGHTFIMNCKDTFEHCQRFIERASFKALETNQRGKGEQVAQPR